MLNNGKVFFNDNKTIIINEIIILSLLIYIRYPKNLKAIG